MEATLAEPIMPNAVDSSRRIEGRITLRSVMAFGSKPEELAATRPMKRSRARWVPTLRMKTPIEWSSFNHFLFRPPLASSMLLRSHPLGFQLLNRSPQPLANFFFDFMLRTLTVEEIQCVARQVEGNVPARDSCGLHLKRYQVHQNTVAARLAVVFSVVVQTGRRVFKNIERPRRTLR